MCLVKIAEERGVDADGPLDDAAEPEIADLAKKREALLMKPERVGIRLLFRGLDGLGAADVRQEALVAEALGDDFAFADERLGFGGLVSIELGTTRRRHRPPRCRARLRRPGKSVAPRS